jgi:hypothetical protein
MMAEILRRRGIRFRLTLFGFRVHVGMRGGIGVVMFFDGSVFLVSVDMLGMIVVLMLFIFTMRVVKGFGLGKLVRSRVLAVLDSVHVALADRLARQGFGVHRYGDLWGGRGVWLRMPVTMIVVFQILENVADVQESVAVEPDIHEGRLHARKHPGDPALIDTTDQRELFFALDVNFD